MGYSDKSRRIARRTGTQGTLGLREHSQAEHGLHGDKQGWHVEGFEEHLCCLLPVLTWVEWSLC